MWILGLKGLSSEVKKSTAVYKDKDLYKYLLLAFLAAYCASLAFLSSFS